MPFIWSSFGATKPHGPTHINGGSDELDSPLNPAALSLPSVLAQDVVDAVNALESGLSVASAQDVIDSMGSYWDHYTGMSDGYALSDDVLHSNDAAASHANATWTKKREITITNLFPTPMTARIVYDYKVTAGNGQSRIYKNGVGLGAIKSFTTTAYATWSEDLSFADGDTIELYLRKPDSGNVNARNFRVLGQFSALSLATAISENSVGEAIPFTATNTL